MKMFVISIIVCIIIYYIISHLDTNFKYEGFYTSVEQAESPANVSQPAINYTQPAINSTQPAINSTQPAVNSTQTEINSTQPEITLYKPEVFSTLDIETQKKYINSLSQKQHDIFQEQLIDYVQQNIQQNIQKHSTQQSTNSIKSDKILYDPEVFNKLDIESQTKYVNSLSQEQQLIFQQQVMQYIQKNIQEINKQPKGGMQPNLSTTAITQRSK